MSHLVRKAVTFGKEQPVREKLNCFSLSACCSKFLLALPVIWREKCGACSAVSECEGGWVDARQPLLFAVESITKGWVCTRGGFTRSPLSRQPILLRRESFVTVGKLMALLSEAKLVFPTLISQTLGVFVGKTTLFTKAEFVRRLVQAFNRGEMLK